MLEENLKQGNSLNRLNRNEAFQKLKILMQQSLSSGVTSLKMSKILIDHFKTSDGMNSRVIIFSNFRGSVRGIMDALANIEHVVKATQFIGQSSVLACEGSELKGYLRKQGSCKTLQKHLRNGGKNTFNFYPSPRMKFSMLSSQLNNSFLVVKSCKMISVQLPTFEAKLDDSETDLLRRYFQPTDNLWRPSLIAFPHFQSFPSRVHSVMHSFRSEMLIDAMQYLQGSSYFGNTRTQFDEVEAVSDLGNSIKTVERDESIRNELQTSQTVIENSQREVSESHVLPLSPPKTDKKQCFISSRGADSSIHSYLFGTEFESVDGLGKVLSVPPPPLKDAHNECTSASTAGLQSCSKQDAARAWDSLIVCRSETEQVNYFGARPTVPEGNDMVQREFSHSDPQLERLIDVDIKLSQTPTCKRKVSDEEISTGLPVVETMTTLILSDDSDIDVGDAELSPRLTNLLKGGVVPESPTDNMGTSDFRREDKILRQEHESTSKAQTEPVLNSSVIENNVEVINDSDASKVLPPSYNNKITSSAINGKTVSTMNCAALPVVEEIETPQEVLLHNSCSEDWQDNPRYIQEVLKKGRSSKGCANMEIFLKGMEIFLGGIQRKLMEVEMIRLN